MPPVCDYFIVTKLFQLTQDFQAKLGDFGLSRLLVEQHSVTNFKGTPSHMAPEQLKSGAKHIPLKSDVYSFGMLMYEIATCKVSKVFFIKISIFYLILILVTKVPFSDFSVLEMWNRVQNGERPPIQVYI